VYAHGLLAEAEPATERITIFVGDDDPMAMFLLSERIREQTDLQVVGAAGEATAVLTIIRATQPSVVLLAHLMAGFGLDEGVAQVRAQAPSAKVVVSLSRSIKATEEMQGADGYFRKAQSMGQLSRTVDRVLREPAAAGQRG
jgi:DNA-binding NarL/FixJ family response regulator